MTKKTELTKAEWQIEMLGALKRVSKKLDDVIGNLEGINDKLRQLSDKIDNMDDDDAWECEIKL